MTAARPFVVIVFRCLALLAAIFAFIFFMRMQEEEGDITRLRNQGVVSRAVVVDKNVDKARFEGRRGRSRTVEYNILRVRFVKKSKVAYADFPAKVAEAELPAAPPPVANSTDEIDYGGVMFVPADRYAATKVGDTMVVVNTPFNPDAPELVSEVRDFDPAPFYPRIGLALALMLVFWLIGSWIKRRGRATASA
ncbi:hypothetical protein [Sphingomonas sp. G-3-2-10]|uniref:hypothetical protein n=1 Tax=Sphingomonas sp. G-3-2-10 TaxID=2728838 RepID=UPI00146B8CA2|nr:hypothetical protein [Sphingomonas sp. G-3-2-10]NML08383.1 hypothetical protein [Sphingomonas sp. G-3-2-10]